MNAVNPSYLTEDDIEGLKYGHVAYQTAYSNPIPCVVVVFGPVVASALPKVVKNGSQLLSYIATWVNHDVRQDEFFAVKVPTGAVKKLKGDTQLKVISP